jgi:hypothetical protein
LAGPSAAPGDRSDRLVPVTDRPSDAAADVAGIEYPDRPEGLIAAAILAAGVGALTMGIVTTWVEASAGFKDALTWSKDVGPLSGKTIVTVLVWLAAWAVLHAVYRHRTYETRRALVVSLVLIGLGIVGTFPPSSSCSDNEPTGGQLSERLPRRPGSGGRS